MKLKLFMASLVATFALLFAAQVENIKVEASTKVSYIESNELVSLSKKYIGIRYKKAGTTPSGFDCSGYVQYVYRQLGVNITRSTSTQFAEGTSVAKKDLQVGDLVFFKTTSAKVGHVGIYIGNNQFIHSSTSRGVMVSSINDPYYWGSKYVGARRVASVSTALAAK